MAEEHHTGGCQCGAVRYEADVDISEPITCNCSRCQRLGSRLAFTPRDQFTLLQGEDALSEYRFNSGKIAHLFCATCGIESFALGEAPDGRQMAAINVNTIDGIDPGALQTRHVDGASR